MVSPSSSPLSLSLGRVAAPHLNKDKGKKTFLHFFSLWENKRGNLPTRPSHRWITDGQDNFLPVRAPRVEKRSVTDLKK